MFDDQNTRTMLLDYLLSIDKSLRRIADAYERVSPPPKDRSSVKPADDIIRTPLGKLAEWEREDRDEKKVI